MVKATGTMEMSAELLQKSAGVVQLFVHGNLLREFAIGEKPLVIGRSPDSDIVLADSSISRRHAKISAQRDGALVKDLGSAHGVVVDGQAVSESTIRSKNEFSILQYQFRFLSSTDYTLETKGEVNSRNSEVSQPDMSSAKAYEKPPESGSGQTGTYYGYSGGPDSLAVGSTFLAEVLEIVRDEWRLIALFVGGAILVGLAHGFLAVPTFQTNASVQIEPRIREIGGPFSDFDNSRRINDALVDEVTIIQSRTILGEVVDDLGLAVKASPTYFPFIGSSIARWRPITASDGVEPSLFGLNRYAWSNERIRIEVMDIPEEFLGHEFKIVASGNNTYRILDIDDNVLARGEVGEPVSSWLPSSQPSSLFISQLHANTGTEFSISRSRQLEAIDELRKRLAVSDSGIESSILQLSLTGTSPGEIQTIVNAIVNSYVAQNVRIQSEDAVRTLDFVEKQIPIAKEKMEIAEAKLNELRSLRGSIDLPSDTQVVLNRIITLESQLSTLHRSRAELIERFTPQHPRVVSVDAQLRDLKNELSAAESEARELPTTQREVLSISREVSVASELYLSLVNRAEELQIVSAYAATTGNLRVVDYASKPTIPFRPNRSLYLIIYIMLGILLSGGIILFQRQLRSVVRDPELIEERFNLPIFATLRHSARQDLVNRSQSQESKILAVANPTDAAIEGMRSLRTSLQFTFVNSENNVLLITGPTARIGKTFVASNLAAVLAASGRNVVLVDADLRRGRIHELFNLSREPGLADAIGGELEISDVTYESEIANLHVVTAGAVLPNPSELLMNERYVSQLKELSSRFDNVIIDSPPLLAVTDAALISRLAGVVLLVAKCGEHSMREVEQSIKQLTRVGANLRGIVFNDMPMFGRSVYGYQPYSEYAGKEAASK